MPLFNRVVIIGVGLIGGSLGMAIRRQRLARDVIGLVRREAAGRRAVHRGAVDRATRDWTRALHGADLVVVALPVDKIIAAAPRLRRLVSPGTIVTDAGSTKTAIVRAMARGLPRGVAFVGGHPLAGSERSGVAAARADLFEGAVCCLTPTAQTSRRAVARVRRLWQALGSRVAAMSPAAHDRLVARISHAPHLAAIALTLAASPRDWRMAAPSLREMTRIAKSDPALWEPILRTNRAQVSRALGRLQRELAAVRRALVGRDAADLRRRLRAARRRRLAAG